MPHSNNNYKTNTFLQTKRTQNNKINVDEMELSIKRSY